MSEKYIELREEVYKDTAVASGLAIVEVLDWLDEHPEACPGRTITRTEMRERMHDNFSTRVDEIEVEAYTESLGRIVVPDPEPTPRQRLEALIFKEWGDADDAQHITDAIVAEFDVSEKAPGGDDER